MLKSFTEKIFQGLTDIKPGRLVLSDAARDEILYKAKRVRAKDYVFNFDVTGSTTQERTETTTARWTFICTGVAFFADNLDNTIPPTVGVKFESLASLSPFRNAEPAEMNRVLTQMVIPFEGKKNFYFPGAHFEEYKNLFAVLDQRVNITVSIKPGVTTDYHAAVIITGVEVFEGGEDE